jgi:hypothetical protein
MRSLIFAGAIGAAISVGAPAPAGEFSGGEMSYISLALNAKTATSSAWFFLTLDDGFYDPEAGTFTWELDKEIVLTDPFNPQTTVATIMPTSNVYYALGGPVDGAGPGTPTVNLNFAVMAGAVQTEFTISSALLSFNTPISPAEGRASAAISVTDVLGNGANLTGAASNGGSYIAQYNGLVPTGTTFAELIPGLSAPGFGSNAVAQDFPGGGAFAPIGAAVSNMSSQFHFTLSAFDQASGTSTFEIVPAPATLALLGIGALLGRRRRRA